MSNVSDVLNYCLSHDDEAEWFDFKENWCEWHEIGEYISALSNAAAMVGEPYGYLIWGVNDETHELTNTTINYNKDYNHEPVQHFLSRKTNPSIFFQFEEDIIDDKRVVVLRIPAARVVPTEFDGVRYIRIGSSKENIKRHPEREAALFSILNYGVPTMLNTESRYSDLSFDQLFLYYETKGIKLKKNTFKKNLELLTPNGKYNLLAQMLSDHPHIPIRFALFAGKDKTSTMYSVKEFGDMCLLLALDKVNDYGDTLNVPQADERNRKTERKEVMLFDEKAFKEAVLNAFQHNLWTSGTAPMFTAFQDRIEITSIGTMPSKQTKEGFYAGVSIPVNDKLTEILVQLHISEKSGRGVPRIVGAYGEQAFIFRNNSITVTIPFNRVNLRESPQDILPNNMISPHDNGNIPHDNKNTPQDTPQDGNVTPQVKYIGLRKTAIKILEYCNIPRSRQEILDHLGLNDRKSLMVHINKLIDQGRIAMTVPDKPSSKNQKYVAIE